GVAGLRAHRLARRAVDHAGRAWLSWQGAVQTGLAGAADAVEADGVAATRTPVRLEHRRFRARGAAALTSGRPDEAGLTRKLAGAAGGAGEHPGRATRSTGFRSVLRL